MYLSRLFQLMAEREASDLFVSAGTPIHIKINNETMPVSTQIVDAAAAKTIAYEIMNEEEIARFERDWEMNLSHIEPKCGNFRVNIMKQRGSVSMVIRYVRSSVPDFSTLKLPEVLLDLALEPRGLVLVVGATGSGKSTTLASMVDHRNTHKTGHILTIEDPIEYLFRHKRCIVNQREIGNDSHSYDNALFNALREAPDMLLIGEVRDRSTMQHALTHALTGHLCLSTLHATNSYHALSRILNMYPQEARSGLLSDLSFGLKAIIGQRLVRNKDGKLQPAVEVLINTKLVSEMIAKGDFDGVKEAMEKSLTPGSCTFEQALANMYIKGDLSYDDALAAADSPTNLAWLINQTEQHNHMLDARAQANTTSFEGFDLNHRAH